MEFSQYKEGVAFIQNSSHNFEPEILIVLGSGLGFLADTVKDGIRIPYESIPHCPVSTAPGHAGELVLGQLEEKPVALMNGRVHTYEGYSLEDVTFLIRVCRLLGANKMIITNACGAINEQFHVGDLLLITDYIKFIDTSPLTGPTMPQFGPRFPDMSYVFTPAYQTMAKSTAKEMGIALQEGVYCFWPGPQYETPAEIRAARTLGADVAGMSTVPECIAASHMGMQILGVSLITNMAAGVLNQPLSEEEVLDSAKKAKSYFSAFILACLAKM